MSRHAAPRHRRRNHRGIWAAAAALTTVVVAGVAAAGSTPFARGDPEVENPSASLEVAALPRLAPPPPSSDPAESTPSTEPVEIPKSGSGTFAVAQGSTPPVGSAPAVTAYRVEVEQELPYDAADFADAVDTILADERGWTKDGRHAFERTPAGSLRVVLATPATTDRLCAPLQTRGEVSCRNGDLVVINAVRWTRGAASYGDDLSRYRIYVINHEVGHSLGLGHATCPGPGLKAPVMLQQTLRLDGCIANPWP